MKVKQPNNRPKSKNNPQGKPKEVKVDWSDYNEHHKAEGINWNKWVSGIADKARELLGIEKGVHDRRVSAF